MSPAPQPTATGRPSARRSSASPSTARIAAPVGVHSSRATPPSAITPPASRRTSSAAGAGTGSMPCAHVSSVPWPIATLAHVTLAGAQPVERGGGPDDVDDRVDRADLVERDLLDGRAVELGLGAREAIEDIERASARAFGERARRRCASRISA